MVLLAVGGAAAAAVVAVARECRGSVQPSSHRRAWGVIDADFTRVLDALGTFDASVVVCGGVSDVERGGVELSVGSGVGGDERYRWWECLV